MGPSRPAEDSRPWRVPSGSVASSPERYTRRTSLARVCVLLASPSWSDSVEHPLYTRTHQPSRTHRSHHDRTALMLSLHGSCAALTAHAAPASPAHTQHIHLSPHTHTHTRHTAHTQTFTAHTPMPPPAGWRSIRRSRRRRYPPPACSQAPSPPSVRARTPLVSEPRAAA